MFTLTDDDKNNYWYDKMDLNNIIKIPCVNDSEMNINYDCMENLNVSNLNNAAMDPQFQPFPEMIAATTEDNNYISTSYELLASQNDNYLNSFQNPPVQDLVTQNLNLPPVPISDYALVPCYYLVVPENDLMAPANVAPVIEPVAEEIPLSLEDGNNFVMVNMEEMNTANDNFVYPDENDIQNSEELSTNERNEFFIDEICQTGSSIASPVAHDLQSMDSVETEKLIDAPAESSPTQVEQSLPNPCEADSPANFESQETQPETGKKYQCKICPRKFNWANQLEIHMGIHVSDKLHHCPVCQVNFYQFHFLKRHMRTHTSDKKYTCEICQEEFDWPQFLEEHNKRCFAVDNPHMCDICQAEFSTSYKLKQHARTHSKKKTYECNVCHKKLTRQFLLNTHMLLHTGPQRYECDICKIEFSSNYKLKQHMRMHTDPKKYECSVCHKKFIWPSQLNVHMRHHTGEKRYECDVCHVKFTTACNLKNHKYIHTGRRPYECDICHANFARPLDIARHIKIHSAERKDECEICHLKFKGPRNLKQHMRIHTNEKPFKCDNCQSTFSQKFYLTKHMQTHYSEKSFECDYCQTKFSQKPYLIRHIRTLHYGNNPYGCNECSEKFHSLRDLHQHKSVHTGEIPYQCDVCKKIFFKFKHLLTHERIHAGEKLYKCDICNAGFNQIGQVQIHKIKHHESPKSDDFKCKFCDESFMNCQLLKHHLKTHKNDKFIYCTICLYKTRWPMSLKVHVLNHSKPGLVICHDCGRSSKRKNLLLRHRNRFHKK
ncbi:zinc finger protein 271-like [Microplitis mediator]|uniref:zinc finger protein 271-like n=1 Tax=Microplitis mediator TaxID=375433 RepID=UPI002555A7F5|nr:zinc finger protein 271-like [Microplitis mediator]